MEESQTVSVKGEKKMEHFEALNTSLSTSYD